MVVPYGGGGNRDFDEFYALDLLDAILQGCGVPDQQNTSSDYFLHNIFITNQRLKKKGNKIS